MKKATLVFCLVFALIGCMTKRPSELDYHTAQGGKYADLLAALNKAETQWASARITSYSCHIRRHGVFGGSIYKATYRDGSCSAKYLRDFGASSDFACDENSMQQLFSQIRAAIDSKKSDISASFDHELGYVNWFSVEPHTDIPDQGWGVELSHFKALKRKST